jgi:hypothetical protein
MDTRVIVHRFCYGEEESRRAASPLRLSWSHSQVSPWQAEKTNTKERQTITKKKASGSRLYKEGERFTIDLVKHLLDFLKAAVAVDVHLELEGLCAQTEKRRRRRHGMQGEREPGSAASPA